jgi:hypothetical protein
VPRVAGSGVSDLSAPPPKFVEVPGGRAVTGVSAVSASDPPIRGASVRPIARAGAAGATRFGPSFGDSSDRRYGEEFGQLVVGRAEQAVVVRQLAEVGEIAGGTAMVVMK